MSEMYIGGLEKMIWPFTKKTTSQEENIDESRREFLKLSGATLASTALKTTGIGALGTYLMGHSQDAQAATEIPEVFAKHPDPAIAYAWMYRNNKYMLERIFGFRKLGWNEKARVSDFPFVKQIVKKSSMSTPSYHWITIRGKLDSQFRGSITIKEKPLEYLVKGMKEYRKERNHKKAEKSFLTSLFLSSGFSQQSAQAFGFEIPQATQEAQALSYTTQYLQMQLPQREQILSQMKKNFDKQSQENLMIGYWNVFFLATISWVQNGSKNTLEPYTKLLNVEFEKKYFLKKKQLPRIRGPPGDINY